jgi:hypothetical protein
MTASCPISPDVVDDRATRIGAALVILAAIAGLWSSRLWIPLALALDFALRSRGKTAFSPIAQLAKALRKASGLEPVPINAGPKRFAALVGAIFSLVIAVSLFLSLPRLALAAAAILILCAALEAFLGFCVGCKVYSLLQPLAARTTAPTEAPKP